MRSRRGTQYVRTHQIIGCPNMPTTVDRGAEAWKYSSDEFTGHRWSTHQGLARRWSSRPCKHQWSLLAHLTTVARRTGAMVSTPPACDNGTGRTHRMPNIMGETSLVPTLYSDPPTPMKLAGGVGVCYDPHAGDSISIDCCGEDDPSGLAPPGSEQPRGCIGERCGCQ